jgi:hypothetical protein
MVIFSPVITDKHHPLLLVVTCPDIGSAEETASDLMVKCSPSKWHVIPAAVPSPHDQRAHGLRIDLNRVG